MTYDLTSLRLWRAEPLAIAASAVTAAATSLLDVVTTMLSVASATHRAWHSGAADASAAEAARLAASVRQAAEEAVDVGAALSAAAEQVESVEGLLRAADSLADAHGLSVGDDGSVHTFLDPVVPGGDPLALQAALLERERVIRAVQSMLATAQTCAIEVDRGLTAALDGRLPHALSWVPVPGLAPTPPPGATPARLAAWWSCLSTTQREQLIVERADWVGAADGLPGWVRDRANRLRIDGLEAALVRQLALDEPAELDPASVPLGLVMSTGAAGSWMRDQRAARRDDARAKLRSLQEIQAVLDRDDGVTRQLLVLDTSGRLATAALSAGDVDTAGHVAVYVPGLGTTVDGTVGDYDHKMTSLTALADRQSRAYGDGRATAVVTWLGYQAPQWGDTIEPGRSVATFGSAATGAPTLRRFVRGVDESRPADPPHLSLLGHSYGSLVTGVALAGQAPRLPVDDLVVFGSPGVGVRRASDLGLPPERVHVLEAWDDAVGDLGRFGTDPDTLEGVDVLATTGQQAPDGHPTAASSGHSEYLDDGTTSQWNIASVVAGTPGQTVKGDGGWLPSIPLQPILAEKALLQWATQR